MRKVDCGGRIGGSGTGRPRPCCPRNVRSGPEAGFALISAVLVLIILTGLATAGFLLASTDFRISSNHRASVATFYSADAGKSDFLAVQGVPESTQSFAYGDDQVTVTSTRLLNLPGGESVYAIRSDGLDARPYDGGSRRRVSTVSIFYPFPLTATGAFTAVNGLIKNGASGTIDGNDYSSPGQCPYGIGSGNQPAEAGVTVPPGGYQQNGGGAKIVPKGDPPVDESMNENGILDYTGIDWEGLVTEEKVTPDYRIPGDTWPDYSTLPADEWPVIHVTSDLYTLSPTHSGWGAIILDEDVELSGAFNWSGIILVGGRLVTNGLQNVSGTVITGLNRIFPGKNPAASEIGNGNKNFLYNSCDVEAALRAMGWLAEKPGTWRERLY